MKPLSSAHWGVFLLLSASLSSTLLSHPAPDIPVHATFSGGEPAHLRIEIDPRCFENDPEEADYLLKPAFESGYDEEARAALLKRSRDYLAEILAFEFSPNRPIEPEFSFDFEFLDGAEIGQEEQVLHIVAQAEIPLPTTSSGYRIRARELGKLAVQFLNRMDGRELTEFQVLTSGEQSSWLDFRKGTFSAVAPPPPPPAPSHPPEKPDRTDATDSDHSSILLSRIVPMIGLVVVLVTVFYLQAQRKRQR